MTPLLIRFYSLFAHVAHQAEATDEVGSTKPLFLPEQGLPPHLVHVLIFFAILTIVVCLYFCLCGCSGDMTDRELPSRRLDGPTSTPSATAIIKTCPVLKFYQAKDIEVGRGDIECVICLEEFQDDDELRLLPKCDHMFHRDCIDNWFVRKVICPLCRMEPTQVDD
ncbi:hypothetical protein ACFE04_008109 [Oxalis oulophora]